MRLDALTKTAVIAPPGWAQIGASDTTAIAFAQTVVDGGGRIWGLDGDNNNTVVSSDDGLDWQSNGNLPYRVGSAACLHNGLLYVSGGSYTAETNDVFYSPDGLTWTRRQAPWPARYGHCMISYRGELMVFGGRTGRGQFFQDLWKSQDGVNWRSTAPAPFGPINGAAAIVGGRLCALGGPDGGILWYDGQEWSSDTPPWSGPRLFPGVAVLGDRLYVVGGSVGIRSFKDMWSCTGPRTWRPEPAPPWTIDLNGPCVGPLEGAILVFGGSMASGPASRNIYRYTP